MQIGYKVMCELQVEKVLHRVERFTVAKLT